MKTSKQKKSRNIGNISRRDFVGKVGKAAVAFTIIPGNLQGEESSKRLVLGTSRRSSIADNLTSARISPFRGFYIMFFLAIWICLSSSLCIKIQAQGKTTNLKELWDSVKVCKNPDKGWYHHYYDNGTRNYLTQSDSDLDKFPGMDHLYIRLSWAHFEPQEGQFDWHWIDDIVSHWVPKGYKISLRISCKETGETYATPKWVVDAGAKGTLNGKMWCPIYDDPVFLAKLTAFHQAVAARYDGQPWLSYVDVGAIGTWGEGHEYPVGNQPSVAAVKKILDMYAATYKNTLVVSVDDMAGHRRSLADEDAIAQYSESKGFSWRDDTPLVGGVPCPCPDGVKHPYLFADVYQRVPTVLEEDHYSAIKRNGLWVGKDGSTKGADLLLCAMRTMHATYIGFHGNAVTWLSENPNLTRQMANECGYWFFSRSITIPENITAYSTGLWKIIWENHGVAPAYHRYILEIKFGTTFVDTLVSSDCRTWPSKGLKEESYLITPPSSLSAGSYAVSIRMTDPRSGRKVELALKDAVRDEQGFYKLTNVNIMIKSMLGNTRQVDGTVKDIDGNVYNTVKIGSQIWMTENLKTTKLNDRTAIPLVTYDTAWCNLITPGYCWYNNDTLTNKNLYGALYNWYTLNTGKLCPLGWHVPTDTQWTTLIEYLGGERVAGDKLKKPGVMQWNTKNDTTIASGFAALGGGNRYDLGRFFNVGCNGFWWSATESSSISAWSRYLYCDFYGVHRGYVNKKHGFSVRCLKD